MERLYPVFLKLAGVPCLIVGGGKVATRKAKRLVESGAQVRVVSPEFTPELQELARQGKLELWERPASPEDVSGHALVFCTASDSEVNRRVAQAARQAGAQVNVADAPEESTFYVPAVVERDRLQIAVSTSGASPALAKQIRLELEERFGGEYALILEVEAYLRKRIIESFPQKERPHLFRRLAALLPKACRETKSPAELRRVLAAELGLEISSNFEQLIAPFFR
ncbi:MAG: bifunctional precorrin-2 dehydrogenase/sirohydrochlorin ferrochelatase [Firmicutes bacterium]|nr:bifunctional precorrin-2 dehydrogenase/sirohydrochlorin ferrochelatase [Bacillota bacterium]